MDKRVLILFILVGVVGVLSAGYIGFATNRKPEPAPAPQTVSVERCDVRQTVTAPGSLVNVNLSVVRMPATGQLTHVSVRLGDGVLAGQTLAELDDIAKAEAQLKFVEAQDELAAAQKNRAALDYPRATSAFIKEYKQKIRLQKKRVAHLLDAYDDAIGAEAKAAALKQLSDAQAELNTMEINLNWYMGRPSESDIAAADSALAVAQAKFDAAKAALERLTITTPIGGIVLESTAQTGVTFNAESPLFKIGDPKDLEVEANITEEDFPLVSLGQEVELFFDARSDATVTGRVDRIIPKRIEGDRPRYQIYITLDEVPDGLADGMTADASITIAKRENVLCLPRSVVRASGVNEVSLKVWNGASIETRQVVVGLRGDSDVEILSGLKEGEQAVIQ